MKTPPGIYVHAETNSRYRVFGIAVDSTNGPDEGKLFVVYVSLSTGKLHVRDAREFHEEIKLEDSDGSFRRTKRFRIVEVA